MSQLENPLTRYSVLISRAWRDVFYLAVPKRWLLGRIWRWLFLAEDGRTRRRVGEWVLRDLREYAGMSFPQNFPTDPLRLARQQGRRDVVLRIVHFLNLDETQVQQLMEVDDE